jgi:arylsulfatase A-like enzyme
MNRIRLRVQANRRVRPFYLLLAILPTVFLFLFFTLRPTAANSASSITNDVLRPSQSSPHVIVIVADTLRSDHLSTYGYGRPTSPNLTSLMADQGARFDRATTAAPWTCPSNAAMFTGRKPSTVGSTWETIGTSVPPEETTLAEYLHDGGYYTAGFISTAYCVQGDIGFDQGFDHYDDHFVDDPNPEFVRAADINDMVFDWLDTTYTPNISGTQPLYLFLYYFDPHTWYNPPAPYDTLYDPDYDGPITPEVFGHGQTAISGDLTVSADDLEHLKALYDGEITYWDDQFGQMMARLDQLDILDNAIVVVTTDHGEMFSEHGQWSHGGSLYEEVLRIPLLVRYPGVITAGLTITSPAQNMDLMPTVLDYVGLPLPANLQAVSLRPSIEGQSQGDRPIYSEVDALNDPTNPLYIFAPRDSYRTMHQEEYKLIAHLGNPAADELYLLQPQSPYETDNLAQQEADRYQAMRNALFDWFFPFRLFLPADVLN